MDRSLDACFSARPVWLTALVTMLGSFWSSGAANCRESPSFFTASCTILGSRRRSFATTESFLVTKIAEIAITTAISALTEPKLPEILHKEGVSPFRAQESQLEIANCQRLSIAPLNRNAKSRNSLAITGVCYHHNLWASQKSQKSLQFRSARTEGEVAPTQVWSCKWGAPSWVVVPTFAQAPWKRVLSNPTEIPPPPYRETGVAIPLSHCVPVVSQTIAATPPLLSLKNGLSQCPETDLSRGVVVAKACLWSLPRYRGRRSKQYRQSRSSGTLRTSVFKQ